MLAIPSLPRSQSEEDKDGEKWEARGDGHPARFTEAEKRFRSS